MEQPLANVLSQEKDIIFPVVILIFFRKKKIYQWKSNRTKANIMKFGLVLILFMTATVAYSQRLQYHRPLRPGHPMMSGIMQVYRPPSYPKKYLIIPSRTKTKMIRLKIPAAITHSKIQKPKTPQKPPTKGETSEHWPKTTEKPRKNRKSSIWAQKLIV